MKTFFEHSQRKPFTSKRFILKKKYDKLNFLLLITIFLIIAIFISGTFFKPNIKDIILQFYGLFLNFVVFGIILTIYDSWRNKKLKIINLLDQLDDFWYWKSEEGVMRKVGIIKRLIELNHNPLLIHNIYLKGANFSGLDQIHSYFISNSDFESSIITNTQFLYCGLCGINFSHSNLFRSEFISCTLNKTIFEGSDLRQTKFKDCNLDAVNFKDANLSHAIFRDVGLYFDEGLRPNFTRANLHGADFCGVDLSRSIGLTHDQIKDAIIDNKTILPEDIRN